MLPESTAMFITRLSDLVPDGITYPVEQVVLRYLVDSRACPLCVAPPGSPVLDLRQPESAPHASGATRRALYRAPPDRGVGRPGAPTDGRSEEA
jgi:hypothetical protein